MPTLDEASGSDAIPAALAQALSVFPPESRFLIAFSGGIDSAVLLHAAVAGLGPDRCLAAHINHGLHADADAWQIRCAAAADALGVSFISRRVRVQRAPASSLEASAREARYSALATLYREYDVAALVLGQHADDQAETVLLQLLRGAGLPGLAAMGAQVADPYGMTRVRPLLGCTRAQIEAYASQHGLSWIEDPSNQDPRYVRNALRQQVTPLLEQHFAGYREALARVARHAADAQILLDDLARQDLALVGATDLPEPEASTGVAQAPGDPTEPAAAMQASDPDTPCHAISRAAFLRLSAARAANLLRYWMRLLDLPAAPSARLEAALQQIRSARVGTALRVDHAGHALRVYRGQIRWEPSEPVVDQEDLPEPVSLLWDGQATWHLPAWRGTLVFGPAPPGAIDAIPADWLQGKTLTARVRVGGERMRTGPAGRLRKLKNLFQEHAIPAWRRQLPLLLLGDNLLWVPGLGFNYDTCAAQPSAVGGEGAWLTIEWVADLTIA